MCYEMKGRSGSKENTGETTAKVTQVTGKLVDAWKLGFRLHFFVRDFPRSARKQGFFFSFISLYSKIENSNLINRIMAALLA